MRLYELLNEVGDHDDIWSEFDPRLSDNLTNIMSNAAERVGVTLGTTSGFRDLNPKTGRDSAGSASGRHTHGNASDTALYLNGERLSVNNPEHVPYIQAFTKEFLNNARSQGYSPSVGIGTEYMSGNTFHYDISSGQNRRPDGNEISGTYWGNNSRSAGAVSWLPELFNNTSEYEIPDFTPSTLDARMSTSNYSPTTSRINPRFDRSALAPVGTTQYNLRSGTSGEDVSQLQSQLADLGYLSDNALTGSFDRNTANAVRQFQQNYGLRVDSIAGDQTMSALNQIKRLPDLAPDIPSPSIQSATRNTPTPSTPDIPRATPTTPVGSPSSAGIGSNVTTTPSTPNIPRNTPVRLESTNLDDAVGIIDSAISKALENQLFNTKSNLKEKYTMRLFELLNELEDIGTSNTELDRSALPDAGTSQFNIRRGSSGENVSRLQQQLSDLGYDLGSSGVDGKFGPRTAAAVRQFQQDRGIQVDGIVGDQTMGALSQLGSNSAVRTLPSYNVNDGGSSSRIPSPSRQAGNISPDLGDAEQLLPRQTIDNTNNRVTTLPSFNVGKPAGGPDIARNPPSYMSPQSTQTSSNFRYGSPSASVSNIISGKPRTGQATTQTTSQPNDYVRPAGSVSRKNSR